MIIKDLPYNFLLQENLFAETRAIVNQVCSRWVVNKLQLNRQESVISPESRGKLLTKGASSIGRLFSEWSSTTVKC